jgi:hypothetical protein
VTAQTWKQALKVLLSIVSIPPLPLPLLVVGSLRFGTFTKPRNCMNRKLKFKGKEKNKR